MSLAVIENQQQRRPGGCAGIFFQLLDWNRKLARKKLFSKKQLPHARSLRRPDKNFAGDEKIPRATLTLISNENRGGFPNMKKMIDADEHLKNGTRPPGLIARLMGLDSMPNVDREKPRKALDSGSYYECDEIREFSRLDRDLCHEIIGHGKLDSRPQKLQKTGDFFESCAIGGGRCSPDVTRWSACSRKQQHKLASPVKSPRLLSRSNQARLMQAATKILEPAMQSRSRRRQPITCVVVSESERAVSEDTIVFASKEPQSDSFIGSCRSCGGIVDISKLRCGVKEPVLSNTYLGTALPAVEAKFEINEKNRHSTDWKEIIPNTASKCVQTLGRAEYLMSRDDAVSGSKLCRRRLINNKANECMRSKDIVGVKKRGNSSPRLKSVSKASRSNEVSTGENILEKNLIRKRRLSSNLLMGNGAALSSSFIKQRSTRNDIVNRKESRTGCAYHINRNSVKKELQKTVNFDDFSSKDTGIVSFTFSSPIKHDPPSSVKDTTYGKSGEQRGKTNCTFRPIKLVLDASKDILPSPRIKNTLREDELSILLETRIRELNSLCQDGEGVWDTSGRTTVSILKELISAFTFGESAVQNTLNDVDSKLFTLKDNFDQSLAMLYKKNDKGNHSFDLNQKLKTFALSAASSVIDNDYPSPISILDASLSSESCSVGSFSGSVDMKECKTHRGSCNKTQSSDLDFELHSNGEVSNSSSIDSSMPSVGSRFRFSDKLISNTKLLLGSSFFGSENTLQSSANSFLCDIYASISAAFFARMSSGLSSSKAKICQNLKDFLFDCLMETLDSKFNDFCIYGYKAWLKLPFQLSKEKFLQDIDEEIGCLIKLAGKRLDGLAEQELSSSTVRWAAFDADAYEISLDMEGAITLELVDELVADLCDDKVLPLAELM